jgi:glutamate--cysteine ligase
MATLSEEWGRRGQQAWASVFAAEHAAIEGWLNQAWQRHRPPLYGSVDLRQAGFKLAPVDTNLYPGGFNNVAEADLPGAVRALGAALARSCPGARRVLLIPEAHTRNPFYARHLALLFDVLQQTGLSVRVGALAAVADAGLVAPEPEGIAPAPLEPIVRRGGRVGLTDFDPCVIVLNNDLSGGIPLILQGLQGQCVLPPLHAGWAVRRKSHHFSAYDTVAEQFAAAFGIDPWRINPYFERCERVDFLARTGEDDLAQAVARVLERTQAKYREYGIEAPPFVMVKADAGTYGMGIMSVKAPEEMINLSRRQRNKMAIIKEGLTVSDVLIQEGVPTLDTVADGVAEPVVYLADGKAWGGFYRVHGARRRDENLNATGAYYVPISGSNWHSPGAGASDMADPAFYACGVVARLAMVAAALELERTDPAHAAAQVA